MSRFTSIAAGAAIAAVLNFYPAFAGPAVLTISAAAPTDYGVYQTKSATVTLSDIDTATPEGAAAALQRISAASRAVCGEREGRRMNSARTKVFQACVARTVKQAVAASGSPALSQVAMQ